MYIGVDIGGTNLAAGIVDEHGRITARDSLPTLRGRSSGEIITDIARLCRSLVDKAGLSMSDIKKIGAGCPGTIDTQTGTAVYVNNLKMEGVPLAAELERLLQKEVHLENDANAAAYGEYCIYGDGVKSFIMITLGTGVGSGIILDGKIYRGFNGAGGELGHMTLVSGGRRCSCGKDGCWEAYASVTALIAQTEEAIKENPQSLTARLAADRGKISGRTAFEAAKAGDRVGSDIVSRYAKYVADGIVSAVNIFQPEKIVIGGGISREGDYLLKPVAEIVKANDYNKYRPHTQLETAKLFNDAGIIGAALAAR